MLGERHLATRSSRGTEIDINTVHDVVRWPPERPGSLWDEGDALLAGGTWLFSEQQPQIRRLVDLQSLGWPAIGATDAGLTIGATCTISELYEFDAPSDWRAGSLLRTSCEAFLASFKVWNSATVGGNICMSLPAGPMITLTVALEAVYTLWAPDGSERTVDAADFVTGNHANVLAPGEVLRKIDIPISALRKRNAHRRFTLTKLGRSTIFMIGTQSPDAADLLLTITAATTHPIRLRFNSVPDADALRERIDELPDEVWFDDANGAPDHRRHLAKHYAEEIRMELAVGGW
jgi:CO/xanthine dehydrogenase FAD-binding subunit